MRESWWERQIEAKDIEIDRLGKENGDRAKENLRFITMLCDELDMKALTGEGTFIEEAISKIRNLKNKPKVKYLDAKEVEKIFKDSHENIYNIQGVGNDYFNESYAISQILSLAIPGEVIATGGGMLFWRKLFIDYNDDGSKLFKSVQGKEVEILIKK